MTSERPTKPFEETITFRNLDGIDSWSSYEKSRQTRRKRQRRGLGRTEQGNSTNAAASDGISTEWTPSILSGVEQAVQNHYDGNTHSIKRDEIRNSSAAVYDASALINGGTSTIEHTKLHLQWTRLHPSSFYRASVEIGGISTPPPSTTIAARSSMVLDRSAQLHDRDGESNGKKTTKTKPTNAGSKDANNGRTNSDRHNDAFGTGNTDFFQIPNVHVDLTRLISPPLMSEWIPGVDIRTTYGNESPSLTDPCWNARRKGDGCEPGSPNDHNDDGTTDDGAVKSLIETLLRRGARNAVRSVSSVTDATNTNEEKEEEHRCDPTTVRCVVRLDDKAWSRFLPSRAFQHELRTAFRCGNDTDTTSSLDTVAVGLSALVSLIETCPSEALGRYVLRILAPEVFRTAPEENDNDDYGDEHGNEIRCESYQAVMRELTTLLIYDCRIGCWEKNRLRSSMGRLMEVTTDTAGMFVRIVGDSYYGYPRNR